MTSSVADTTMSVGSRVGRYFSLVSMVPSLFLVLWTAALTASNAWAGKPDIDTLKDWLAAVSVRTVAWMVLLTLIVALFLHPLQFAMTRLLEGYWGSSLPARVALRWRIGRHRRRHARLKKRMKALEDRWRSGLDKILTGRGTDPDDFDSERAPLFESEDGNRFTGLHAARESIYATLNAYPALYPARDRILPTRLGNALRSGEDSAGRPYGIDAILIAPHLALVAEESHVRYLRDSRQQLDTAVRLCVVSFVAFLLTTGGLLTDGWWLLLAMIPYTLSYVAYRASVASAADYMVAVATVIDLNRFKVYERLHIELPDSTAEERRSNRKLMKLLDEERTIHRNRKVSIGYRHPATVDTSGTPPTPPGNP
ncbi:hypothetical protein [Amycolatopsis sp. NPDC051371]|uniref:hypothetical protein n=1 Tax=Amycolatopsis sp. NPDC051371 TaxID=3155800 RepID=UPI00343AFF4C